MVRVRRLLGTFSIAAYPVLPSLRLSTLFLTRGATLTKRLSTLSSAECLNSFSLSNRVDPDQAAPVGAI